MSIKRYLVQLWFNHCPPGLKKDGPSTKVTNRLLNATLAPLLLPIVAVGQQISAVTGVVTDPSGAAISGVEVRLTNNSTATTQSTRTGGRGAYLFTKIAPGTDYVLTFSAPGFVTLVMRKVPLQVGVTETRHAQMSLGTIDTAMTVTASGGSTLNTTDASIGNVMGTRQLLRLPVQIRESPAALPGLQSGVIGDNVGAGGANRLGSVTGSRADQGNIKIGDDQRFQLCEYQPRRRH